MLDTEFDHLISRLLGPTPPRVWSLLVTMFGDLAVAPDARLSGATVNALTSAIGIKPEATRVALHRLRKEGWIESHRTGRQTRYGLTAEGRAETNCAWPRVYGPAHWDGPVFLVMDDPSTSSDQSGPNKNAVQISARSVLTTQAPEGTEQMVLPFQRGQSVPQWVSDKLCPTEVQHASQELNRRLQLLLQDADFAAMTDLQRTALRVTVVHEWRRLILRVPAFPECLFSDRWHGAACRAGFAELLRVLPLPELTDLDGTIESV